MNLVSEEKLKRYFSITQKALQKAKPVSKTQAISFEKTALEFLDMAQRYFDDAWHFEKKGDIVTAFACLNYAHGWLDAGARLGLFDVGGDSTLFSVD